MKRVALILLLVFSSFFVQATNKDYFVFGYWNPDNHNFITGMGGFIDSDNKFGRGANKQYIVFVDGPSYCGDQTAYIYEVETLGNPALHPQETDPSLVGAIAPRKFTLVSSHYMGNYCSGHDNAFVIDNTGIYYGASDNGAVFNPAHPWIGQGPGWATFKHCGIYHWDFDWTPIGCEVPTGAPGGTQTLTRNTDNGDWWAGTGNRRVFRWKNGGSAWEFEFQHPTLMGSHEDGMAYANGSLFISDMTSDHIIRYELDPVTGLPTSNTYELDPVTGDSVLVYDDKFDYTAAPVVENMAFGPNLHIWVSGWNSKEFYELGGGKLQQFLNKAPNVDILVNDGSGPVPLPVGFDASGSNDPDGFIGLWSWDFDGDGHVDLAGHNEIQDTQNLGGIPFSDPGRGFSCSSGQQLDVNGVVYCKYASVEDGIKDWFENVEKFKNTGITTVGELLEKKFDPYIWGESTAQKEKVLRGLIVSLREKCTKREHYTPPASCSNNCKVSGSASIWFTKGECILPEDIKSRLELVNSPAAPYYQLIFDLGKQKGIDPAVALAFFAIASNYGKAFNKATWLYLTPGTFNAALTATDNLGLASSGTVTINALPPLNKPPVAAFKAIPREGFVPLTVDIDASNSYDPDGDILDYKWSFSDKPRPGAQGKKKFSVVFDNLNPIDVTLTVTDPGGKSDSITRNVLPYTYTAIVSIEVKKTKEGEKTRVRAECTQNIPLELALFRLDNDTPQVLAENVNYTCNVDGFVEIGPKLKPGIYMAKAETSAPHCTKCIATKHFVVQSKVRKIRSPELPGALVFPLVLAVLYFTGKKGLVKQCL